jgi:hypothetical protein
MISRLLRRNGTVKHKWSTHTEKRPKKRVGQYCSVTRGSRQTVTTIATIPPIDWFGLAVTTAGMAVMVAMAVTAARASTIAGGVVADDSPLVDATTEAEVAAATSLGDDRRIGGH